MTYTPPLFPELLPPLLPAKHYGWFRQANAHPLPYFKKIYFYPFKDKFLRRFAERDGYDLQVIEHECWDCAGNGCHSCDDGVYRRVEVWLERWVLPDGAVYHKPANHYPAGRVHKHKINGLIRHQNVTESQAVRALLRLALYYDRALFLRLVELRFRSCSAVAAVVNGQARFRFHLRNKYIRLFNRFTPPEEVPF